MGKDRNQKCKNLLSRVADAVANGDAVSWAAELSAHPDCAPQLEELRHIQDILRWYNGARADGNGSEPTPGAASSGDRTRSGEGGITDSTGSEPPLRTWGKLRVLGKLKTGGFGDVYRAFDPELRRDVALKLRRADRASDERTVQEFKQEAQSLASVHHPNVVVVHDVDEHEGFVGLEMDLVQGRDLEEIVEAHGTFGDRDAANVGFALCSGLAELHSLELLHLDIKPSNVMREEGERGGRILLMDFGSCRKLPRSSELTTDLCVTLRSTAPETLRGEAPTAASDIYSIGVLLYWLVSKRYPFDGETREELQAQHDSGRSIRLLDVRPDLSMAFAEVVGKALSIDPRQRYATPIEMCYALAATLTPVPIPLLPPPPPAWWRHALPWVGGAVMGILATVLVVAVVARQGSFRLDAKLYREATPGRERVTSRLLVHKGDLLSLEIRGSKRMYVYVAQHAGDGTMNALFPAKTDLQNPLSASLLHRLPGTRKNVEQAWKVTSEGGPDTLMVIAALERLPGVEERLAEMHPALPDTTEGAGWVERGDSVERGIGQVVPIVPVAPGGLFELRRTLTLMKAQGVEFRTRLIVYPTATIDGPRASER